MAKKKTSSRKKKSKKKKKEMTWDEIGKAIGKKIETASDEGKFDPENWGCKNKIKEKVPCDGTGGWIYFLGFVASLIYYIQTAPTFWDAVIGFFKAIVWPAFMIYGIFQFLGL